MIIPFADESPLTRYHLLTQTIVPRPIAWVLSENDNGSHNLAPFSFFNAMCSDPPLLVMSIGKKPSGEIKDTRKNLLSGRDFVVHIAHHTQADAVHQSAAALDYGESEILAGNLSLEVFPNCPLPRLADCAVAYHCKLYDVHEIGPNQQAMLYAEVIQLYVSDEVGEKRDNRYVIDANKLTPLARLGGVQYAALENAFSPLIVK